MADTVVSSWSFTRSSITARRWHWRWAYRSCAVVDARASIATDHRLDTNCPSDVTIFVVAAAPATLRWPTPVFNTKHPNVLTLANSLSLSLTLSHCNPIRKQWENGRDLLLVHYVSFPRLCQFVAAEAQALVGAWHHSRQSVPRSLPTKLITLIMPANNESTLFHARTRSLERADPSMAPIKSKSNGTLPLFVQWLYNLNAICRPLPSKSSTASTIARFSRQLSAFFFLPSLETLVTWGPFPTIPANSS